MSYDGKLKKTDDGIIFYKYSIHNLSKCVIRLINKHVKIDKLKIGMKIRSKTVLFIFWSYHFFGPLVIFFLHFLVLWFSIHLILWIRTSDPAWFYKRLYDGNIPKIKGKFNKNWFLLSIIRMLVYVCFSPPVIFFDLSSNFGEWTWHSSRRWVAQGWVLSWVVAK